MAQANVQLQQQQQQQHPNQPIHHEDDPKEHGQEQRQVEQAREEVQHHQQQSQMTGVIVGDEGVLFELEGEAGAAAIVEVVGGDGSSSTPVGDNDDDEDVDNSDDDDDDDDDDLLTRRLSISSMYGAGPGSVAAADNMLVATSSGSSGPGSAVGFSAGIVGAGGGSGGGGCCNNSIRSLGGWSTAVDSQDFTLPTSNIKDLDTSLSSNRLAKSPPLRYIHHHQMYSHLYSRGGNFEQQDQKDNNASAGGGRRAIFGASVEQRYAYNHGREQQLKLLLEQQQQQRQQQHHHHHQQYPSEDSDLLLSYEDTLPQSQRARNRSDLFQQQQQTPEYEQKLSERNHNGVLAAAAAASAAVAGASGGASSSLLTTTLMLRDDDPPTCTVHEFFDGELSPLPSPPIHMFPSSSAAALASVAPPPQSLADNGTTLNLSAITATTAAPLHATYKLLPSSRCSSDNSNSEKKFDPTNANTLLLELDDKDDISGIDRQYEDRIGNFMSPVATTATTLAYDSEFGLCGLEAPSTNKSSSNNIQLLNVNKGLGHYGSCGENIQQHNPVSPLSSPLIGIRPSSSSKSIPRSSSSRRSNSDKKIREFPRRPRSSPRKKSLSFTNGLCGLRNCFRSNNSSMHGPSSASSLSLSALKADDELRDQQGDGEDVVPDASVPQHKTTHAQSLLLGLVFAAVWTPNNLMAPNLTEMASDFGMETAEERDLYLGSYCALATGVFSFPLAAGIGILTDLYSRQRLFCYTAVGSAIAAIVTGKYAQTFAQLWFLRLAQGGFMAASVPIAFSLLGDLFTTEERNAASSGLTAMMGIGLVSGQVYAGMVGTTLGWEHAFYVSGGLTIALALLCFALVDEPERGGKERVLQDMIQAGTRYDRKLTWSSFWHAMRHNQSNSILLWQGFFSSLPWGIIFVFLNDYLSQERGFSVPDATFLVLLFGIGCAIGGILGGYLGQAVLGWNRSYLPLFMSVTTLLGVLPFYGLLNTHFTDAHGLRGISYSVLSGLVASLPSVNVRPCLINVNAPETRGAALTAANLLINLGRGMGPSCVTLLVSTFQTDRQKAFNITLILFWVISAIQLALLAKTLPNDQDAMESELALYALQAMASNGRKPSAAAAGADNSFMSIEDRMTSFDGTAARQTFTYVTEGIRELKHEMEQGSTFLSCACNELETSSSSEDGSSSCGSHLDEQGEEEPSKQMSFDKLSATPENEHKYPDESSPLVI